MLWIPGRKHGNKHKKPSHKQPSTGSLGGQRGPTATVAGTAALHRAMMSGDSPDTHAKEPIFELKDSASSSKGEALTASVLVEPQAPKKGALFQNDVGKQTRATSTDDEAIETATTPIVPRKKTENDPLDITDSALNANHLNANHLNAKLIEEKEDEEDGCGVKCLYYTLQCCECTIM